MNKILNKNNNSIWYWFFAISVLTLYNLTPRIDGFDTQFYYLAGEQLCNGHIDCLRTPVYPLLLQLFSVCFGHNGSIVGVTILQSIIYLISAASLRNITKFTIKNRYIQESVAILYVICVAPGWCNEMMTESLSISGCVIIADQLCRYISRPSYRLSISIFILTFLLVFLRPSFIFLFAIAPMVWIVLWIRKNNRMLQMISLTLSLACVVTFLGYCKAYEKEYGVFSSSISFICNDIYNLQRSGAWDTSKISNHQAQLFMSNIEDDINYAPTYEAVSANPKCLPSIVQACEELKTGSEKTLRVHQLKISAASFDKHFNASVNTKTPLSAILFASSLFLSLPLSLFYAIVVISFSSLVVFFLRKRNIPLIGAVLVLFSAAQCIGIVLYASEAHERLLLPVYPLFLILLGLYIEKALLFINHQ